MFAVIKTGGKQYVVTPGMKLKVEKIPKPEKGNLVDFAEVLAIGDEEKLNAGKSALKGAKVTAEWQKEGRAKKVIVSRYHSKTRYRKLKGHRQPFTEVLVKDIISSL